MVAELAEELGGAAMHASISGTIDYKEPTDEAALERVRSLVDMLPEDSKANEYRKHKQELRLQEEERTRAMQNKQKMNAKLLWLGSIVTKGMPMLR